MPYRIFNHVAEATSCGYYRSVLPTQHLNDELQAANIEMIASNKLDETHQYDAYIFGRVPDYAQFMFALKAYERGAKIIWDIDDDFMTIPDWSTVKDLFGPISLNYLEQSFKMAGRITVSTRHLADAVASHWPALGGKVTVLENLIDPGMFAVTDRRKKSGSPTPEIVRILWTGSHTHIGDLGPVRMIMEYIQEIPGFVLIMYGYLPEDFLNRRNIIHIPYTAKRHYEGVLSLISPDVALMPLLDCPFNRCKSAIKFYECTMAGALCVASNIPPFADVMADHITGLLLDHDNLAGWLDAVNLLRHHRDADDVECMRGNARREVIDSFSWTSDNMRKKAWIDFFLSIPDKIAHDLS